MYIDRRYRSKYRRRSRWPITLAVMALAAAVLYALLSAGILVVRPGPHGVSIKPYDPFRPVLPSMTPTRSALSYLAEAEDDYQAGKLASASEAYARAAALEPGNDEAYQWQAWLLVLRGHPTDAVPLARKAVTLKPSAMNLAMLAISLDWSESYDEALSTALKAVDADPLSAEAHAALAEVYADKNNWMALQEAQNAVKINPSSVIAQRDLGYVLQYEGRYADAVAAYAKAAQIAPYLGYVFVSAGNTYMAMGDNTNAIAQYQKAVDANPDDPVGYDNLGRASGLAGDPDTAIATLRKAIEVDPTYGLAYAHLAEVYYSRFNYEAAIENFQKAVDEGVRGEQYYYEYGLSYYDLNDCRNATVWLQKALEVNPDSKLAQDALQLCAK